jgi:predicted outer membrane repeat protein
MMSKPEAVGSSPTKCIFEARSFKAAITVVSSMRIQMIRKSISVLVLIGVLSAPAVFTVTPAQAATITVTSKLDTADPGHCRLRDAITAVGDCPAGTAGLDTIGFSLGLQCNLIPCTITLTNALPTVTENLTINGNATTIDGANAFRVFDLDAVIVNMSNLKIANANVSGSSFGGAILMSDGTLTLTNVFFSNNRAISGGAIYEVKGTLNVVNSNFSGNIAGIGGFGGAIANGSGSLSVVDSTFNNNSAVNGGGAIVINNGASIVNSTFSNNSAPLGGAIENSLANLTVGNCVFDNNSSSFGGGAIAALGSTNIFNSTFSNNTAPGAKSFGGAVYFESAGTPLILTESTLFNNSSTFDGGAAYFVDGPVTLRNLTISGNSARNNGGGIVITETVQTPTTAILNNVTITNNLADSDNDGKGDGGGIFRAAGTAQVQNSIIAGNFDTPGNAGGGTKNPDCSGAFSSQGHNLIGRNDGCSGFINGANGDKAGAGANPINPLLGGLANNGGPTRTHALFLGSPAVDAGNPLTPGGGGFTCAGTDQRGIPRPQGAACDIGAVERHMGEVTPVVYAPAIFK